MVNKTMTENRAADADKMQPLERRSISIFCGTSRMAHSRMAHSHMALRALFCLPMGGQIDHRPTLAIMLQALNLSQGPRCLQLSKI
jgi:hypothetical protein